jgi:carboxypeptidase family protein/TonB-dependent receptor-like protein
MKRGVERLVLCGALFHTSAGNGDETTKFLDPGGRMRKTGAWLRPAALLLTLAACLLMAHSGSAQNIISGEIVGTVTDSTGAVVPNATVDLASSDTGYRSTQTTGPTGTFRFSLVKPGNYTVTVTGKGFATYKQGVVAQTGQAVEVPVKLEVGELTQTIEVTADAPLVQTTNANLATTVTSATAEIIPNAGQDITNLALTAPGVSISTGGAYGNFAVNGLGGTSNLFTVNGADYNDPDNNLNNSGASNMALGTNELQEATVVLNGYTGEYGRAAGANLNYSTKSGTNTFHGNAIWYWNGTRLNANDWFSNAGGAPRGHAVSNQWAGSIGGPIIKNKLFFFYNNEGSRYVLPGGGGTVFTPTTAFANAVQANLLAANAPAAVQTLYKTMFGLYAGAPGSSLATPATDSKLGCGDFSGTAVGGTTFGAGGTPCAQQFQSNVNSLNKERLMSVTVDWNATDRDALKFRWKQDRGVQATSTDPINSAFSANSVQPEWDVQVNWTHTFNSRIVNQFIASGLHYSAIFGPPNIAAALSTFPTSVLFNDGAPFTTMGGGIVNHELFQYPSGRNVATYQIVDDFSWARGAHTIKFGVNFRRDNLGDFTAGQLTSGEVIMGSMTDFYNGVISNLHPGAGKFIQNFANINDVPEKNYSLGVYFQDEWRMSNRLKLTLATRFDRNSPVVCNINCFTRFTTQFEQLNHNVSIPYSQSLSLNSHSAMAGLEKVVFAPRVGFAWTPTANPTMVVRGGIGIFSDLYPLYLAHRFFTQLPNVAGFTVSPSAANNNIWIAPGAPNGIFAQTAASNAALHTAIANGGTLASVKAAVAPLSFALPNFASIVNNFKNPKYLEWNLELEKSFGGKTTATVGYVGNHGYDLVLVNYGMNTYCDPATMSVCSNGPYGSLPTSAPDPRFARVQQITNNGYSNYEGLTFGIKQRATQGLYGGATYTYFHSLDNISNGGFLQFSLNAGGDSIRYQIDPNNTRSPGYGNSDYDFRHTASVYYVWALPLKPAGVLGQLVGGWTVSEIFLVRGGEPFTVYDTAIRNSIGNGASITTPAVYLGGPTTCSASAASTACLSASNFATSTTQQNFPGAVFGNLARNSFRGPGYFDTDLSLYKDIKVREAMTFTIGANAYNVLNHPNFGNPTASITSGSFGSVLNTVGAPNSPYGNFTGAIVNGRILQLVAKFKF